MFVRYCFFSTSPKSAVMHLYTATQNKKMNWTPSNNPAYRKQWGAGVHVHERNQLNPELPLWIRTKVLQILRGLPTIFGLFFFKKMLFKHILQSRFKSRTSPVMSWTCRYFFLRAVALTWQQIQFVLIKKKNNIHSSTRLYFIYLSYVCALKPTRCSLVVWRLWCVQLAEEYLSLFRWSVPHLFSLPADDSCSPKMRRW